MPANAPSPRLPTTSRPAPGSVDEDLCRVTFGHPHHQRDGSFGAEDLLDDLLQLPTRLALEVDSQRGSRTDKWVSGK